MNLHESIIEAMRATDVEAPQTRGLWTIRRDDFARLGPALQVFVTHDRAYHRYPSIPTITTALNRLPASPTEPLGETVMSDDPKELRRHLAPVLAAHGRVLVSGLGLGCVARGLLANPSVTRVDVVEVDEDILAMVAASVDDPRLSLHLGDARTIRWPLGRRWDFAWHDVWGETPSTQVLHAELLVRYRDLATRQGAWMLPRYLKRIARRSISLIG